jgi:hypothetical protein
MGFNATKFRRAKFQHRTADVQVPELKELFDEGEAPVFKVRGLSGEEFYQVREAVTKRKDLQAIASRLMSGQGEAIAAAIDEYFNDLPEELMRRTEVLVAGCVSPTLDREAANKMFKHFPTSAHIIAEAILRATGEGSILGELKGSGETQGSDTTCALQTCEESASSS